MLAERMQKGEGDMDKMKLNMDQLEGVVGGAGTSGDMADLRSDIAYYKKSGISKQGVIDWYRHMFSGVDGAEGELNMVIDYINDNWDSI